MSAIVIKKAKHLLASLLLLVFHCHQSCAVRKSFGAGLHADRSFHNPDGVKMAGNAFMGVSLSRYSGDIGHPDSETLQNAFDLNEVADREYKYIVEVNDDGWLIGGGEAGPYKLPAADSSHITIMDVGTFNENWGGISQEAIIEAIESGDILIPQIEVMPTRIHMNWDVPPELELLFDLEPTYPTKEVPLPINWQLRFISNQLVDYFSFPNLALPSHFHCSLTRKVNFRSYQARGEYFEKCNKAIARWRKNGPQPLVGKDTWKYYNGNGDNVETNDDGNDVSDYYLSYASGVWIYSNRQNRTKFIRPNFLPPYDTDDEKMEIITRVLTQGRYISNSHIYVSKESIVVATLCTIALSILLSRLYQKRRKNQDSKLNSSFLRKDGNNSSLSSKAKDSTPPSTPPSAVGFELSPISRKLDDDNKNHRLVIALEQEEIAGYDTHKKKQEQAVAASNSFYRTARSGVFDKLAAVRQTGQGMLSIPAEVTTANDSGNYLAHTDNSEGCTGVQASSFDYGVFA